jgi:hypothetical protein
MSSRKIQATKNYALFHRNADNRVLDLKKHRKLYESMKRYGFLRCFPIVCFRDSKGNLIVKDGQHRLAIAQELGVTVYWVEETVDFDVAVINCTAKVWQLKDYALKFSANGNKQYQEGIEFAEQHGIPIGSAFAMLAGNVSFSNVESKFIDGTFKVKDRKWADDVAAVYGPLVAMSHSVKRQQFLEACMAVCRVDGFDSKRLISNAERCREKLVAFSTRDAYLDMLETIYNFGRSKLVGLKVEATMAMRERNLATKTRPVTKGKEAA